ncbi:hypothetical protein D9758_011207 [Tetrapyrgos nigripes]|uniref:F-box domain-containing protein n=1 Tax=Tetrapyrgos nigripes TaxID=182062 RepID=A0A8H5D7F0_9AGAR|nr:hypothetical protein D9758_011207 [Tetrapyrgos nigripes]
MGVTTSLSRQGTDEYITDFLTQKQEEDMLEEYNAVRHAHKYKKLDVDMPRFPGQEICLVGRLLKFREKEVIARDPNAGGDLTEAILPGVDKPSLTEEIPFELLSEIFIHSIIPAKEDQSAAAFPSTLARVCQRWCNVAYATPQLWTAFSIEFPILLDPSQEAIASRLDRSKGLPLTLHLKAGKCFDLRILPELVAWRDVLRLLMREFSRWQHLTFALFKNDDGLLLEPSVEDICQIMGSAESFLALVSAIRLACAFLTFDGGYWNTDNFPGLPLDTWPLVENLSIIRCHYSFLLEFLQYGELQNLRHFAVEDIQGLEDDIPHGAVLFNFSSLSIIQNDIWEMSYLMEPLAQAIEVPALKSLTIGILEAVDSHFVLGDSEWIDLCTFLEDTQCAASLEELHLQNPLELVTPLRLLPNLQFLSVIEMSPDDDVKTLDDFSWALRINDQTGSRASEVLLPKLKSLKVITGIDTQFSLAYLAQAVDSRWIPKSKDTPVVCLESFHLTLGKKKRDGKGKKHFKTFRILAQDGLKFTYTIV